MPEYRLFETRTFLRDVDSLGPPAARRIRSTLESRVYPILRVNPRGTPSAARLQNWDPPTWRIRVGQWRVFFEIDDDAGIVFLTAAQHRKDAYR